MIVDGYRWMDDKGCNGIKYVDFCLGRIPTKNDHNEDAKRR